MRKKTVCLLALAPILGLLSGCTSADAGNEGKAKYDITVVAVTVDDGGVIRACRIDSIPATVSFDQNGVITSELADQVPTKNELGDDYGMKRCVGSAYEWNEQADALARYAVDKTVEQLKNGAVDETGHAADADLASTATISIGGFQALIAKVAEQ